MANDLQIELNSDGTGLLKRVLGMIHDDIYLDPGAMQHNLRFLLSKGQALIVSASTRHGNFHQFFPETTVILQIYRGTPTLYRIPRPCAFWCRLQGLFQILQEAPNDSSFSLRRVEGDMESVRISLQEGAIVQLLQINGSVYGVPPLREFSHQHRTVIGVGARLFRRLLQYMESNQLVVYTYVTGAGVYFAGGDDVFALASDQCMVARRAEPEFLWRIPYHLITCLRSASLICSTVWLHMDTIVDATGSRYMINFPLPHLGNFIFKF